MCLDIAEYLVAEQRAGRGWRDSGLESVSEDSLQGANTGTLCTPVHHYCLISAANITVMQSRLQELEASVTPWGLISTIKSIILLSGIHEELDLIINWHSFPHLNVAAKITLLIFVSSCFILYQMSNRNLIRIGTCSM